MKKKSGRTIQKEWLWVILPCVSVLILQLAEYTLYRYHLELRSPVQIIKGVYLWMIAPLMIVFGFYRLYSEKNGVCLCRFLTGILIIIIFGVSYARAGLYLFNGEYQEEKLTEEGILIGTVYNTSREIAYDPVGLLFRTPFRGRSEEALDARLKECYGSGARLLEEQEDGRWLCTADSGRTGVAPFYFVINNDYRLSGNFPVQLMKCDASVFWKTRDRYASLINYESEPSLELFGETDVNGIEHAFDDRYFLNVQCVFDEGDIPVCAADLADWIFYLKEDPRNWSAGLDFYDDPLARIRIYFGEEAFYIELPELSQWVNTYSWSEMKEALEEEIRSRHEMLAQLHTAPAPKEEPEFSEEAWAESFMESYDEENYEKECLVGDGAIRYRMVCIDAALGSRAYSLLKSTDAGASWQVQERDPFGEQWGMGIDFTFLTEDYGFATLMHNGGDEADLYVTEDGGHTYHPCVFEGFSAELEDGYYYQPYDYPQMPYEEEGRLYVLCGQGADGDYAGGDAAGMALFESTDRGYTFLYQRIQK